MPTPSGEPFTQRTAEALAGESHLVLACGRYEGIDARVAEHYRVAADARSPSSPSATTCSTAARSPRSSSSRPSRGCCPGVVGNPESLVEESHGAAGLLEYPVYTKPPAWAGLEVPEVLLSGHHARIARWRRDTGAASGPPRAVRT